MPKGLDDRHLCGHLLGGRLAGPSSREKGGAVMPKGLDDRHLCGHLLGGRLAGPRQIRPGGHPIVPVAPGTMVTHAGKTLAPL